jgi:hypothetical protein
LHVFSTYPTLAERVGCSVRTVQRALQAARALGLVDWAERRVRAAWRWLRASNRYVLALPEGEVLPGLRRPRATTGHLARGGESKEKEGRSEKDAAALSRLLHAASALPDLLRRRRQAMQARWEAKWRAM